MHDNDNTDYYYMISGMVQFGLCASAFAIFIGINMIEIYSVKGKIYDTLRNSGRLSTRNKCVIEALAAVDMLATTAIMVLCSQAPMSSILSDKKSTDGYITDGDYRAILSLVVASIFTGINVSALNVAALEVKAAAPLVFAKKNKPLAPRGDIKDTSLLPSRNEPRA